MRIDAGVYQNVLDENRMLRETLFKVAKEINELIIDLDEREHCKGCVHKGYKIGCAKICLECENGRNKEVE